jgi:hypothetical protein
MVVSSPKGPVKAKEAKVVEKLQPAERDDASSANATPQLGPSHDLDIKDRIEKIKQEQKMERMAEIQRQQQRKKEASQMAEEESRLSMMRRAPKDEEEQ